MADQVDGRLPPLLKLLRGWEGPLYGGGLRAGEWGDVALRLQLAGANFAALAYCLPDGSMWVHAFAATADPGFRDTVVKVSGDFAGRAFENAAGDGLSRLILSEGWARALAQQ